MKHNICSLWEDNNNIIEIIAGYDEAATRESEMVAYHMNQCWVIGN